MRIETSYYDDVIKVTDPCSFSVNNLVNAQIKVYWETGKNVRSWPITIEFNERTEQWEVYFIKPVADKEEVEGLYEMRPELRSVA